MDGADAAWLLAAPSEGWVPEDWEPVDWVSVAREEPVDWVVEDWELGESVGGACCGRLVEAHAVLIGIGIGNTAAATTTPAISSRRGALTVSPVGRWGSAPGA